MMFSGINLSTAAVDKFFHFDYQGDNVRQRFSGSAFTDSSIMDYRNFIVFLFAFIVQIRIFAKFIRYEL